MSTLQPPHFVYWCPVLSHLGLFSWTTRFTLSGKSQPGSSGTTLLVSHYFTFRGVDHDHAFPAAVGYLT